MYQHEALPVWQCTNAIEMLEQTVSQREFDYQFEGTVLIYMVNIRYYDPYVLIMV